MRVSVTVAVYPIGQHDFRAINTAIEIFRKYPLQVEVQQMHTELEGEVDVVFRALQEAFHQAAEFGLTIMTVTISNACSVLDKSS